RRSSNLTGTLRNSVGGPAVGRCSLCSALDVRASDSGLVPTSAIAPRPYATGIQFGSEPAAAAGGAGDLAAGCAGPKLGAGPCGFAGRAMTMPKPISLAASYASTELRCGVAKSAESN